MSDTTPPKARHKKRTRSISTIKAENETTLPSQFELTTLAAALDSPNNTPDATAARALAVWRACGEVLKFENLRKKRDRELLERLARFGDVYHYSPEIFKNSRMIAAEMKAVPLTEFLKSHFSKNSKPAHMLKKFRDFLRDIVPVAEDNEETSFRKTADAMRVFREHGVRGEIVADLSLDFEIFLKTVEAENKVERARKGGIARREKAEKSPQRKKTLGSKKDGPKQKKAGRKQ
jgi:hypothetical protein